MNTSPHTRTEQVITHALRLANISVYLGLLAVVCFCVFGTLASLPAFKDSTLIYLAFHYLTYALIGLSMPLNMYQIFLLWRYRIIQPAILLIVTTVGVGLLLFAVVSLLVQGVGEAFFMGLFLAMIAWFAMPFLFRVNFKKFLTFLQTKGS